jgi:soluble lytic murein transglycosylase-like protein
MRPWALLVALCLAAPGQTQDDPYRKARAAAQECRRQQLQAVEKQRTAVKVQARTAFTMLAADCDPIPEQEIAPMIQETAKREGLPANLLHAVIERESGFRPCAVSPKGAQGLMQLMPPVIEEFKVSDPLNPRQSLGAGAKLLKELLARYHGDVSLALGAYNAGPDRVDSAGGIPPIPETVDYVKAIVGTVRELSPPQVPAAASWDASSDKEPVADLN